MARRLKKRHGCLGVLLLLVGLVVWALMDSSPPDLSDFIIEQPAVDDAENGWVRFQTDATRPGTGVVDYEAYREVKEALETNELVASVSDLVDPLGEQFQLDTAEEFVELDSAVSRAVGATLALPRFRSKIEEPIIEVSFCASWAGRSMLRLARGHLAKGREEEAMRTAVSAVDLGRRLCAAQAPYFCWNAGRQLQLDGHELLRRFLASSRLGHRKLAGLLEPLVHDPSALESLVATAKASVMRFSYDVRAYEAGVVDGDNWFSQRGPAYRFFFKPNATIRLAAKRANETIALARKPYWERPWIRDTEYGVLDRLAEAYRWILHGSGESAARPISFRALWELDHLEASRRATRIALALVRYREDHPAAPRPADLSALVPDYLSELPEDPFDGQPLRYSSEAGIVYSIGVDGVDSGGAQTRPGNRPDQDRDEPTFRLFYD